MLVKNLVEELQMKKYGLQLRVKPSQPKQTAVRPPLPTASAFVDDDDDDVEREISRQATKNKALKDTEDQHKKALEQDPSAFAYDEVYDDIKQKTTLPRMQDREERKPRYIQQLIKKAEERKREHDIIYEKKLAKERSKDEHVYADKDKFITSAYKKKLAEQAKWMEEQRLRDLQEEKEDVTKKKDLSDFYFNLGRNVAFGAAEIQAKKVERLAELRKAEEEADKERIGSEKRKAEKEAEKESNASAEDRPGHSASPESSRAREEHKAEASTTNTRRPEPREMNFVAEKPVSDAPEDEKSQVKELCSNQPKPGQHKRSEDAIAAARERFLARKKAKVQ